MSQSNSRKRRGRGRSSGRVSRGGADHTATRTIDFGQLEDAATFWARSNARLGMDPVGPNAPNKKSGKPPVEFDCAMCGGQVLLERWPKNRQDVRCDACQGALGGMLKGEEREISVAYRRANKDNKKYEGLPEFSDEDKAAIADMQAKRQLGNGRVGNRKRGGGQGKRRKGGNKNNSGGGGGDGRKRRRRRRGRGRSGGGGDSKSSE